MLFLFDSFFLEESLETLHEKFETNLKGKIFNKL